MKRFVLAVLLVASSSAPAQWCPLYPPPYHDIPKECSPYLAGDPVVVHSTGTYSWHRPVDIELSTPAGPFKFSRLFANAPTFWRYSVGDRDFLRGGEVPVPFGYSTVDSAFWWHSLFSGAFNYKAGSEQLVYFSLPNGGHLSFRGCAYPDGGSALLGCPGWRSHDGDSPGERARLWEEPNDGGLDLFLEDGRRLRYAERLVLADGGVGEQAFLSAEFNAEGRQLYSVRYAQPGEACVGRSGAPYVKFVDSSGGTQLRFDYALQSGLVGPECVLSGISLSESSDAGVWRTVVSYTYAGPGLLGSAIQSGSGGERSESYAYDAGGFFVSSGGTILVAHGPGIGSDMVSSVRDLSFSSLFCVNGNCGPLAVSSAVPPFSECMTGTGGIERAVAWLAAGRGDGTDAGAGFTRTAQFGSGRGRTIHTTLFQQYTDQCAVGACSPGTYRWEHGKADGEILCNYVYDLLLKNNGASPTKAVKNKRDAWTSNPFVWKSDAGTQVKDSPLYAFEQVGEYRGAVDADGTSALERTNYVWAYAAGHQDLARVWWSSSFAGGANEAGRVYSFESVSASAGDVVPNRQVGVVASGFTADLSGVVSQSFRAVFRRTTSSCIAQSNPMALTVRVEGPCAVASATATTCTGVYPVTEYQRDGRGRITGRLLTDSNCLSQEFEQFSNFTDLGMPQMYTDANGNQLSLSFDGQRLTSVGTAVGTWFIGYDNNRLTYIQSPDGDAEVRCYRRGVSDSCSGEFVDQLQWIAIAPSSTGLGWTERIRFDYWSDGTLRQATFETPNSGVRRVERFAFDAHKRMTLHEWGAGAIKSWNAYDGADNLAATSRIGTAPPSFCLQNPTSLDAGYSDACAQFVSDRANRFSIFDQYSDDGGVRQCFDYDGSGNTTRISAACRVTDSCAINTNGASACGISTDFQTDDFGYIVSLVSPDSDNGMGGRGLERRLFGRLGIEQLQTEAMRQNGRSLRFGRDSRGRPTSLVSVVNSPLSSTTTHSISWDSAPLPSGCPNMAYTIGRIAKTTDPVRQTWYSYDTQGRLVRELVLPNGASDCVSALSTFYTYTAGGKLSQVRYPHGRVVRYNYSTSGRVSSIDVEYTSGVQRTIDSVEWEPFGAVRSYLYVPPGGAEIVRVEYRLGDASASDACAAALGANDLTGRLRSVSAIRKYAGTSLMVRNYRWSGAEVASETICYPGGSDITTAFTTDRLGRLTSATGTNFAASGGPVASLNYEYDRLGNRTRVTAGSAQLAVGPTANHPNWISSQASSVAGSKIGYWFGMDSDGDIQAKSTAADSLNAPGTSYDFGWGEASSTSAVSGLRSVPTTMTRRQGSNTQIWTYSYDIATRRTQKVGPLGLVAEFFWSSLGLLEDVGPTTTPGSQKTLDEYVWLNGDPVVIIRAKLDPATGLHVADFDSNCWRENAPGRCQAYGVVSDRLGRPVLTLDHSTAVTGVGEYDPFGHLNRVTEHLESRHPYPARTSNTLFASTRGQVPQGLSLELRPHFNVFDLENVVGPKGTSKDFLYVLDQNGSVIGSYTGLRGDGWTNEWFAPGDGVLRLRLTTNDRNCASGFCGPGVNERSYVGFSMDAYEYRRFTSGVQPYFPPYRGPGLYYDAESDQFQNWHRQLDPGLGRYLSPEPLLQSPNYIAAMSSGGMSVPTYAYAANNPLRYVDRNGLWYSVGTWDPEDVDLQDYIWREIGRAAMDPIIGPKVLEMWASPKEFKIWGRRKFGDSETSSKTCEVDFSFSKNPGYTPDGYRSYNRSTLWHEMGHQWAIAHGLSDFEILREGVMWENRGRMGLPDGRPPFAPSQLRRIHWEDEYRGTSVFP